MDRLDQTNQFSSWPINQLRSLVEGFCLLPDSVVEDNIDEFTNEERVEFIENKELMEKLFRQDLLKQLEHFSDNVKDLQTAITFEGAEED